MGKSSNKQQKSVRHGGSGADRAVGTSEATQQTGSGARNAGISVGDETLIDPDADPQPQTCCPACQTVFEVPIELLESADTRVRCGECLSIFDALSSLRRDDFQNNDDDDYLLDPDGNAINPESPYATASSDATGDFTATETYIPDAEGHAETINDDTTDLDVTYSDFDLFSGEVELPEVAYFDQTQDTGHLRFDDPEGDETFSDTLFSHDLTVEPVDLSPPAGRNTPVLNRQASADMDFVTDDDRQAPVDFHIRSKKAALSAGDATVALDSTLTRQAEFSSELSSGSVRARSASWPLRILLGLLVLVIAGGLYGYRHRHAILENPTVRPLAARFCATAGCTLRPMVALNELKVLKRTVFSHPSLENSLVIDLAFVNQAAFSQPYPVLEIRLTDLNGSLVAQNNLEPSDYLEQVEADELLEAGRRLDLSLVLDDPGQQATSFELTFR